MKSASPIDRRIRISATLAIVGLVIEAISLLWSHPTAFFLFLIVGAGAMVLGIVIFLFSIVSLPDNSRSHD